LILFASAVTISKKNRFLQVPDLISPKEQMRGARVPARMSRLMYLLL